MRNTSDFKAASVSLPSGSRQLFEPFIASTRTERTSSLPVWAFFASFPSVKATLGVLLCRITGSVNIKACFRSFLSSNFLAPTAQKTWPRCQARVELGNFSLFRPQLSVASSTRTAKKHHHNPTVPHKHREVLPSAPTLHTSTVTRVSRWFLGHGRTCGGVWKAVFFLLFFENGDFSYRSRVPTAGICLW